MKLSTATQSTQLIARGDSDRRLRFWRSLRRTRLAIPGGLLVLGFIMLAILAPWIAPFDPLASDLSKVLLEPDSVHWFGTDELGRDVLSRVLFGARISLLEGFVPVAIALAVGVPVGILSGYSGGWKDMLLMRAMDVLMAFPGVLLAIVVVSILGPGIENAMLAVAAYMVPIFARLARGLAISAAKEPYIEACHAAGMRTTRIIAVHLLPNIAPTLMVIAALRVAIAILTASSLGFLGLGAQAPSPEWGAMLAQGRNAMLIAPHVVVFPGAAIILLVLGLNLFQDGLRIALDPRMSNR
mgnify:CR=1 FL=1